MAPHASPTTLSIAPEPSRARRSPPASCRDGCPGGAVAAAGRRGAQAAPAAPGPGGRAGRAGRSTAPAACGRRRRSRGCPPAGGSSRAPRRVPRGRRSRRRSPRGASLRGPGPIGGQACSAWLRMTRRPARGRAGRVDRDGGGPTRRAAPAPRRGVPERAESSRGSTPVTGDDSRRALRRHRGKEVAGNRSVRPRGDRRPPPAPPHGGSSRGALRDHCGRCAGRAGGTCTREPGEGRTGRTGHSLVGPARGRAPPTLGTGACGPRRADAGLSSREDEGRQGEGGARPPPPR